MMAMLNQDFQISKNGLSFPSQGSWGKELCVRYLSLYLNDWFVRQELGFNWKSYFDRPQYLYDLAFDLDNYMKSITESYFTTFEITQVQFDGNHLILSFQINLLDFMFLVMTVIKRFIA